MSFPLAGNSKLGFSIENTLKEHRLPHAVLIDGEVGTGRHTLARFLSRAAVCSGEKIPCDECHNCHLATNFNHPDIIFIAPEEGKKSITVNQIRDLKDSAYIKPHQALSKVFIIDYADTLNANSQNALLKVLEEPPESTVFILITESKASLLPTVISRCVSLSLNVPSFDEGFEYLSSLNEFNNEDIKDAMFKANNNIGKALQFLKGDGDTKIALCANEFLQSALRGDQWGMLNVITPFEKSRVETGDFFKTLKLLIMEEIRKKPTGVRASSLFRFQEELSHLEKSLVTNINLSLLFAQIVSMAKNFLG